MQSHLCLVDQCFSGRCIARSSLLIRSRVNAHACSTLRVRSEDPKFNSYSIYTKLAGDSSHNVEDGVPIRTAFDNV